MYYKELFKLEDCLSANQAIAVHLNIEEATTFAEAFEETDNGLLDSMKIENGLFIWIVCESETDYRYMLGELKSKVSSIAFSSWIAGYHNKQGDARIVIDCTESED